MSKFIEVERKEASPIFININQITDFGDRFITTFREEISVTGSAEEIANLIKEAGVSITRRKLAEVLEITSDDVCRSIEGGYSKVFDKDPDQVSSFHDPERGEVKATGPRMLVPLIPMSEETLKSLRKTYTHEIYVTDMNLHGFCK